VKQIKSATSPGPEFDSHREAIRARGHSVNPYRIGCEVGMRGEDLPNPYGPRSRGAYLYEDGLQFGRKRRAQGETR
jgi:hypothetical protein